jgi:calcineurin-like phosphoesterase family protein
MPPPKLFFTADLHIGCHGVLADRWGGRPYSRQEVHDAAIPTIINAHVGEKDKLAILGDTIWGRDPLEVAAGLRNLIRNLKCRNLSFILGNHDSANAFRALGLEAPAYAMIPHEGHKFFCCHYPMLTWPESHYGSTLCYGHTHAAFEDEFTRLLPQRRSIDVGWDNAIKVLGEYRPFEAGEVLELLKDRAGSFIPADRKARLNAT